ncbi:hypothetical protein evm_001618 [Chilo suppressalis]|nr:hypothetical protein evm_001618 [Chilo suppressalis]
MDPVRIGGYNGPSADVWVTTDPVRIVAYLYYRVGEPKRKVETSAATAFVFFVDVLKLSKYCTADHNRG